MNRKIMIFAPHQDDETIGCGGMISKLREDYDIYIVIATQVDRVFQSYNPDLKKYIQYSEEIRNRECINAMSVLGIPEDKIIYMLPAKFHNKLDKLENSVLISSIETIIRNIEPDTVLIPAVSINQDHKILNTCLTTALRPHFFFGNIIAYEIAYETDFHPNYYVSINQDQVDNKLAAFNEYKSQIKPPYSKINEDSMLAKMKVRGSDINVAFAEAFQIIRSKS